MPSCFICGRTRNHKSNAENITFHRFPSNEAVRNKWYDFVTENKFLTNDVTNSLICSNHFNADFFINYKNTNLLEKCPVPDIIISRAKYAKDKFPEYATPLTTAPNVNINQPLLKVESSIQIDGIIPFNTSEPSTSCIKTDPSFGSPSSASFSIMRPSTNKKNVKASYLEASKPVESHMPNRLHLKRGITVLSSELLVKSKQLKVFASMKDIISKLQKQNLLNDDEYEMLLDSFGKHKNLITNWSKKNVSKKVTKKYTPEVRQFALSLNFFSSKAYEYVRIEVNTILPHVRTLSKWYLHINADPGFTDGALKTLAIKTKNTNHSIYCALVIKWLYANIWSMMAQIIMGTLIWVMA